MNAAEFRRWLKACGCRFETHKGGSGHLTVRRGDRTPQLPMHGKGKELGRGLIEIKKGSGAQIAAIFERKRMALDYVVLLTPDDNGTLLVTCPDLPEVTTFGSDKADALWHARDAIEEAIAARIAARADIPLPSASRGRQKGKAAAKGAPTVARVALPTQTALKAMLHRAMRAQNLRKADLERRLGLHGPQVDRLLNPRHASRLDQIEAALAAVGKRLVVDVEEAA